MKKIFIFIIGLFLISNVYACDNHKKEKIKAEMSSFISHCMREALLNADDEIYHKIIEACNKAAKLVYLNTDIEEENEIK